MIASVFNTHSFNTHSKWIAVFALIFCTGLPLGFVHGATDGVMPLISVRCEDLFVSTPIVAGRGWGAGRADQMVNRVRASSVVGAVVRGAINLRQDFKDVGMGRILFRPATKNAEDGAPPELLQINEFEFLTAEGYGFLVPRDAYYGDSNRFFKTLKSIWQFVPRRVVGLLRGENGHLHDLRFGDPRYAVLFGKGIQHSLLDAPIYSMSQFLNLKRRYVASFVLSMAVMGGTASWVHLKYIDPYLEAQNEEIQNAPLATAVKENREELIRAVRYDIRNRDLYLLWKQTVPTAKTVAQRREFEDTILEAAQLRKVSNLSFFATYSKEPFVATRKSVQEIVRYPQFEHLQSFAPDQQATFNPRTWETLFNLNLVFQTMVELAPYFIDGKSSAELNDALKVPATREIYSRVFANDFVMRVRDLHRQKKLTRDEAAALVEQDLFYRTRLAEQKVLTGSSGSIGIQELEQEMLKTAFSGNSRWDLP